jgi:hypothetical protein
VSEYVRIERADNQAIAEMLKQRLEESGIPCVVTPGDIGAVAGAGASYAVAVPAERADEARSVLRG